MTHTRYVRSLLNLNGQMTNTRRSDGSPEPDGVIKVVARKKIIHYRQLYIDHPEPITFMPVPVDTSVRIYDDFLRLLFLHDHREESVLTKASVMRISIPLDLSSRPFIPPPCFFRSRRPTALLTPSLVFSPLRSV